MELDQINQICKTHDCGYCLLTDKDGFCMLEDPIYEWDVEEIKRRLRKYGKEKEF